MLDDNCFSFTVSRALTGFPRERSLSSERPVLEKAKQNPTDPLKHT